MITIQSDNPAIEKEIRFLEKTITENGGKLDPRLVIHCENGSLSVMRDGLQMPGTPLMALPGEILLPAETMQLSVKGNAIEMAPDKDVLTPVQYELAASMLSLYNLTDKIAIHEKTCPWVSFRAAPDALDAILKSRTVNENQEKMFSYTKQEDSAPTRESFLCDTYIKTRVIGRKEIDRETDTKTLTMRIMPIVDFINHNYNAGHFNFSAGFQKDQPEREFLMIANSQPILESRECFAFYNQMDAIDAYLHYGFPDARAPIVRSVPMEIAIPKTGKLIVNSIMSPWKKGKLAKHVMGIQVFIPQTLRNEDGVLEVSHLIIPGTNAPQGLRRVLRLVISNMTPHALSQDEIWDATLAAEEQVINTNLSFYESLVAKADAALASVSEPAARACWEQTRSLATLQLTKLYKYVFYKEYYEREDVQTLHDADPASAAA